LRGYGLPDRGVKKRSIIILDAHHRFAVACIAALLTYLSLPHGLGLFVRIVGAWDGFGSMTLLLVWPVLAAKDPYEVRRNVRLQDASRTFLFVAVISAAVASLGAVGLLLGSTKTLSTSHLAGHIVLVAATVAISWTLVHTLFATRYAHAYYRGAAELDRDHVAGGLIFPEEKDPDYLDFAYFAFVIGMTCQVSDVQISSRSIRRLALLHGLISFAFNTAILAIVINIVAGLL
jgi:uncharacterized membrane protein